MDPRELDKRVVVGVHQQGYSSFGEKAGMLQFRPSFTQDAGPAVPMQGLRTIALGQMELGRVHHGRVLFGTLCVDAFVVTAVMTVLEDKQDPRMAVRMAVYNAASSRSTFPDVQRLYPKGCRVAIKEPFLKRALDGGLALRVDNPANIEKLEADAIADDGAPHELRQQGNRLFAKENWKGAIDCYTRCITSLLEKNKVSSGTPSSSLSPSVDLDEKESINAALAVAYSNRAEAWMKLSEYKHALTDADATLDIDPNHVKSLFRKGRALYGLMEYEQACACLEVLLAQHPELKDARTLLNSIKSRLANPAEILPGLSDFLLGKAPPPKLPDYTGPVKVQKTSDGRGRGLFALKDVEPGELLLVSNAAAVCETDLKNFGLHLDISTEKVNMASQEDLVTELVSLGMKSPTFLHKLYSLAASPSQESLEVPSMDLFTTDCTETNDGVAVDITRIRQIVRFNSFGSNLVRLNRVPESVEEKDNSGLWLLPSFMNHSCLPNACRLHVGHAMIVHAASQIPAGQEITLSYLNPLLPLRMREDLYKHWSFVCTCKRCTIERSLQSRLQSLSSQFQSIHAEATKHFPAFAADPKNQAPDFYATCFELSSVFKKLRKKINSLESLTDVEKKLVLASYSSAFLGKWFFSWAMGNVSSSDESGVELMQAMRSCTPGNFSTFCLVARLALAAQQVGPTGQGLHPDYLMEQARQECMCLVGKQKASVVEQLVERASKIMPQLF